MKKKKVVFNCQEKHMEAKMILLASKPGALKMAG
jgi:hypothetical protein